MVKVNEANPYQSPRGELSVDVQVERWHGFCGGGDRNVRAWLAHREEKVAAGEAQTDCSYPNGYVFEGRAYKI